MEKITRFDGESPYHAFVEHNALDMVEEEAFKDWFATIEPEYQYQIIYQHWKEKVPQPADR
jgi:hypothetical protein